MIRSNFKRKGFFEIILLILVLLILSFCLKTNLYAAVDFSSLAEVSSQVDIVKSAAMFNRRTSTFFCRITINNPGTHTFKSPIVVVIDNFSISDPSISATFMSTDDMIDIDADGDINPIYVISNADLTPGGSAYRNIQIAFRDASGNLVRPSGFSFDVRAFATP